MVVWRCSHGMASARTCAKQGVKLETRPADRGAFPYLHPGLEIPARLPHRARSTLVKPYLPVYHYAGSNFATYRLHALHVARYSKACGYTSGMSRTRGKKRCEVLLGGRRVGPRYIDMSMIALRRTARVRPAIAHSLDRVKG